MEEGRTCRAVFVYEVEALGLNGGTCAGHLHSYRNQ